MNKIDLENIKKELDKRIAENYTFENGGEMSKDEIISKTTEELNKLVDNFKNDKKKQAAEEIKKLVDIAFEKYSTDPTDNMLVIGACNYYDEDRSVMYIDSPLEDIDFDGFNCKYNKFAHPIGRNYDFTYYDFDKRENHVGKDDEDMKAIMSIAKEIESKFKQIGVDSIEDYWDEMNDEINELWCGVHAITKDYKIVAFVIRDDGWLESMDSMDDNVICEL